MLDMNMFREHADVVRADHTKRGLPHDNIDKVIELDTQWRQSESRRTPFKKRTPGSRWSSCALLRITT